MINNRITHYIKNLLSLFRHTLPHKQKSGHNCLSSEQLEELQMTDPSRVGLRTALFFYIQRSMVFETPKSLRLGSMEWAPDSVTIYFYIDGEIQEQDQETLSIVVTNFISHFTPISLPSCGECYIRVDQPEPIHFKGECFFARKEKYE